MRCSCATNGSKNHRVKVERPRRGGVKMSAFTKNVYKGTNSLQGKGRIKYEITTTLGSQELQWSTVLFNTISVLVRDHCEE
jgi:hypothetical protein